MKRLTGLLLALSLCGCQLQINIASSVVNVPVSKTQIGDDQEMTGSALEDLKNQGQKGGKFEVPLP
jgi:hypothetical protein